MKGATFVTAQLLIDDGVEFDPHLGQVVTLTGLPCTPPVASPQAVVVARCLLESSDSR